MDSTLARRRERQRQATRARQLKQSAKVVAFGILVVAVFVAAGWLLAPVFAPRASGTVLTGNGKIVNIQAAMDGFDIKQVRARVGETLVVNLQSLDNEHHTDGGGKHQFAIDELGVNIVAQPLSSSSGSFTVTQPGVYTYYCDICCGGKANPTMNGQLIVES